MKRHFSLLFVFLSFSANCQVDSVLNEFQITNPRTSFCVLTTTQGVTQNYEKNQTKGSKLITGVTKGKNFEIGSITKTFTGYLIYQEILAGRINLYDPIELYIEGLDERIKKITIHQLLTHTSGLRNNPQKTKKFSADPTKGYVKDVLLADLKKEKINLKKAGKINYSNLGVCILGLCLEKTRGESITDIFNKLMIEMGMVNSSVSLPDTNLLEGQNKGKKTQNWEFNYILPAGGIHSNIVDMGKYLDQNMAFYHSDSLYFKSLVTETDAEVAYLWFKTKLKNGMYLIWHNGETSGFSNYIAFIPEIELGLVILTNESSCDVEKLAVNIFNQLIYARK